MNKEEYEELVYIKTKNGNILKCYVSEQMHKPIYYPVNSKTNGYVDYNDVEKKLDIEDMYIIVKQLQQQLKDKDEKISKAIEYLKRERKNYYEQGVKIAKTNLENLLVSASLCTCDNALEILESNKED